MVGKQLLLRKQRLPNPEIAIDLMGCGLEPEAIAKAVMAEGSSLPYRFRFLVQEDVKLPKIYPVHKAPDCFEEGDAPLVVARRKKTSLTEGIRLVAQGDVVALITAGDTGTLVAASRLFLKPLLPSRTTALMTKLPTRHGPVLLADVGANVNAKAEHFLDFARLGTAFLHASGMKTLKMAMLNIGQESTKGPVEWTKAHQLLKELTDGVKFRGNIEACDLFMEDLDLVITDALAGNILLKTAEGVAKMIMYAFKNSNGSSSSWLDWSSYPGAILAGLEAPIIKVHGYSNTKAFTSALQSLHGLLDNNTIAKMRSFL